MRDRLDEFGDTTIAAITFATADQLPRHRAHLALPFPLLADPEREIYEQFALGRATTLAVWNPGTLLLYAKLLRKGRRLQRSTQDTRQLGGDFVVTAEGTLGAGFWPASPDDRPSIERLIKAVRQ